jgi:hypothetical protein
MYIYMHIIRNFIEKPILKFKTNLISTNSPESMREAIIVIEIICSKPMMHMDTCLKSLNIHWTYSMNAAHFLTWQGVTADLWNSNVEPYWN